MIIMVGGCGHMRDAMRFRLRVRQGGVGVEV